MPNDSIIRNRDELYKQKSAESYNRRHGVKPAAEYNTGDNVRIKTDGEKIWKNAKVISHSGLPRSYMLKTESGKILRRNTKHIMPTKTFSPREATNVNPESTHLPKPDLTKSPNSMSPVKPHQQPNESCVPAPKTPTRVQPEVPVQKHYTTRSGHSVKKPERLNYL